MKEFITEGTHSILKSFPVQEIFEIADHACVSLIETFHIMAGHGADYCFPLDGEARNREGLNEQKAKDDLIDEVKEAMKEANVEEHIRVKTKIGWVLFGVMDSYGVSSNKKITVFGYSLLQYAHHQRANHLNNTLMS